MSHREWDGGEDGMGEKGGRSQMSVTMATLKGAMGSSDKVMVSNVWYIKMGLEVKVSIICQHDWLISPIS